MAWQSRHCGPVSALLFLLLSGLFTERLPCAALLLPVESRGRRAVRLVIDRLGRLGRVVRSFGGDRDSLACGGDEKKFVVSAST